MGKKYSGMTAYDHFQNGKAVLEIKSTMLNLLGECGKKFGSSSRATRSVHRTIDSLIRLQSDLDAEYCKIATKEDIDQYKYPYYSRTEREEP